MGHKAHGKAVNEWGSRFGSVIRAIAEKSHRLVAIVQHHLQLHRGKKFVPHIRQIGRRPFDIGTVIGFFGRKFNLSEAHGLGENIRSKFLFSLKSAGFDFAFLDQGRAYTR